MIKGRVSSIQSMGTLDGPGVRFVVFLQGCPLRCKCCHNPETWDIDGGEEYTPKELYERAARYKEYFKDNGGITLSGGEPLIQAKFSREIFKECKKEGIGTCLDTSGCILNEEVKELLSYTDRVLLDIKYTDDALYKENASMSLFSALGFLKYLNEQNIPTTLRQVIIPGINDNKENILKLKKIREENGCVDKIELLPFKKICKAKYDNMNIEFPFEHIPSADRETMERLNKAVG